MKKLNCIGLYIFLLSFLPVTSTFSFTASCPPPELIKGVKFKEAYRDPYDSECWNFFSFPIAHSGKVWNVIFGTFFPHVKTEEEALLKGQDYFQKAELNISHPKPVSIPDHLLCDYMPTGREFWVSAITPPEMT